MKLTDISTIKELLGGENTFFKKKFGQNFLVSEAVVGKIAASCEDGYDVGVLEIGPGIGTLSQKLCERYKRVVSVEIDKTLIPILGKTMSDYSNFTLISDDILKVDLRDLCGKYFNDCEKIAVCANLPYYITTQILMFILESGIPFSSVTVMVQKEVADRLCSLPGSDDYGAITVALNYYGRTEKIMSVSSGNFIPAPKVDSSVIRTALYENRPVVPVDEKHMFRVIRSAFSQRRKTLSNAVKNGFPEYTRETVERAISDSGLDLRARGETLSIADFAKLSDNLIKLNN
ncbi:MAG: 16S rRNA (adenine(1518)-N(6)/adenine(1519)-N(6))-dimethyltransferase RsmA [Clostridia bacterium]|nr:16S rRNA (adenine(1518)-N(6)/adenine(1519)-N(6))-dimethyltransferase RsmA [Clostridia bacterium]